METFCPECKTYHKVGKVNPVQPPFKSFSDNTLWSSDMDSEGNEIHRLMLSLEPIMDFDFQ